MKVLVALMFVTLALGGCAELDAILEDFQGIESREPLPGGQVVVHYIDVGQGDGVIWELPGKQFVVLDCGVPTDLDGSFMVTALKDSDLRQEAPSGP